MTGNYMCDIYQQYQNLTLSFFVILELYKATFAYETDKEDELSLKVGETVRISNKDSPDWWVAERVTNSKEIGLVPSNVMYFFFLLLLVIVTTKNSFFFILVSRKDTRRR